MRGSKGAEDFRSSAVFGLFYPFRYGLLFNQQFDLSLL